jgi:hypothetical protein
MKTTKLAFLIVVIVFFAINLSFAVFRPIQFNQYQTVTSGLSLGDNYFGRLQIWREYATNADWAQATSLENQISPGFIQNYKIEHNPDNIKKTLDLLSKKENKTTDDWMEMARYQLILGQKIALINSLTQAHNLDPIRDDISRYYFELSR